MSKQQTAVEWLVQEINKINVSIEARLFVDKLEKQAKEMERGQKIMDYEMGYINGGNQKKITGEQYYNETYGGNK